MTIHVNKWFLGAGFLGAPPISVRSAPPPRGEQSEPTPRAASEGTEKFLKRNGARHLESLKLRTAESDKRSPLRTSAHESRINISAGTELKSWRS